MNEKLTKTALILEAFEILNNHLPPDHPFYNHSLRTAFLLQQLGTKETLVACGILHHIPETEIILKTIPLETQTEIKEILKKADLLKKLFESQKKFKQTPIKKWQKEFLNQRAENLRRMFFVIAKSLEPILLTLAGRLDEIQTLAISYSKDDQQKTSFMALEILAPLAFGLGMSEMKGQLEDAAFPYLYPKEYQWLLSNVQDEYSQSQAYIDKIKPKVKETLQKQGIEILEIQSRAKHYFSLYQKLLRYNMDINKIYDLVALRIIVPDVPNCYKALGAIHFAWKPLANRIKDYINSPKKTGYRSLHTTVECEENKIVEFQIKTSQMHQEADFGAAAHLQYKTNITAEKYRHQFYWFSQIKKWQEESKDTKTVANFLKDELFKDQIFVLTPKNDVLALPKGSTVVDFAYEVHSVVGDHCEGAKIDGVMQELKTVLQTGQIVEIITNKHRSPSAKWLRFVKTHKAKTKINNFLEKAYGISLKPATKPSKPFTRVKETVEQIRHILPSIKRSPQILVAGETGIAAKISKCCSPKQGDSISAFITKGEGASIHKTTCPNLQEISEKWPERVVPAQWKGV